MSDEKWKMSLPALDQMHFPRLQFILRRRTAVALLILLFSAIAPALRPFAPDPVTCGMACCEESGVCCCLAARNHDSHEGHDEESAITTAELIRGCHSNCGLAPSSSPGFDLRADRLGAEIAFRRIVRPRFRTRTPHAPASIAFAHLAPRAPPASTHLRFV